MPREKKRKYVRKVKPVAVAATVKDVSIPEEEPVKQSYLECHFCGNKQTDLNSRDQASFWCHQCGRCNQAVWKEE
jgi:hypothetical protein